MHWLTRLLKPWIVSANGLTVTAIMATMMVNLVLVMLLYVALINTQVLIQISIPRYRMIFMTMKRI